MIIRTRARLVPFVLCAMGALMLFLSGCRKEEKKPEIPPSSPESYMRDPVFRGKLSAARRERQELVASRAAIVGKMKAMIDAKKAELKTADPAVVKSELEKDPAWQALYVQCTNANEKVEAHRKATLRTVGERIVPKKPISK